MGEVKIDTDKCIYCGACVGVCPVLALRLKDVVVEWDPEKCVYCGNCEQICPAGAIKVIKE
ncbi:4Fe-4S binding protein [Candidatus Micrarchaeota archaeon]|nr:4Fe-4S binding protein [Candidatus Micrarchaeota archaeon]